MHSIYQSDNNNLYNASKDFYFKYSKCSSIKFYIHQRMSKQIDQGVHKNIKQHNYFKHW